jgi:hypothetical protein
VRIIATTSLAQPQHVARPCGTLNEDFSQTAWRLFRVSIPQSDLTVAKRAGNGNLDLEKTRFFRIPVLDVEQRSFGATVGEGRKITAAFPLFYLRCHWPRLSEWMRT